MGWAEIVREIRGDKTQKEFARLLGVSQRVISAIERGELSPGGKVLRALLKVTPERREELLSLFLSQDIRKPIKNRKTDKGGS